MAKEASTRTRRDRWADWLVLGVLVVALVLGWVVMEAVRGQRAEYSDAQTGLEVLYPRGWLLQADEGLAFQAVDPASSGFRTTYQVRAAPLDASVPVSATLSMALNDASLLRAQQGTAYRLLDMEQGGALDGQPTMESSYAFVAEPADLFSEQLPMVVEGLDIAVPGRERVYVFSLLASEQNYATAEPGFRKFVQNARLR